MEDKMMSLFNAVSIPKVKARGGCLLPSVKDALAAWVLGMTFPTLFSYSYNSLLLINSLQDEIELIWCRPVFLSIPFRNKIETVVKNPDFLPVFRRYFPLTLRCTCRVAQTRWSVTHSLSLLTSGCSLGSTNSPDNSTECLVGAEVGTAAPSVAQNHSTGCCKVCSSALRLLSLSPPLSHSPMSHTYQEKRLCICLNFTHFYFIREEINLKFIKLQFVHQSFLSELQNHWNKDGFW